VRERDGWNENSEQMRKEKFILVENQPRYDERERGGRVSER
jgi:hypothetical protein